MKKSMVTLWVFIAAIALPTMLITAHGMRGVKEAKEAEESRANQTLSSEKWERTRVRKLIAEAREVARKSVHATTEESLRARKRLGIQRSVSFEDFDGIQKVESFDTSRRDSHSSSNSSVTPEHTDDGCDQDQYLQEILACRSFNCAKRYVALHKDWTPVLVLLEQDLAHGWLNPTFDAATVTWIMKECQDILLLRKLVIYYSYRYIENRPYNDVLLTIYLRLKSDVETKSRIFEEEEAFRTQCAQKARLYRIESDEEKELKARLNRSYARLAEARRQLEEHDGQNTRMR